MAGGAVAAAIANLGFATVATDTLSAIPFRLATGAALACVYPVAIKVVAGWFRRERGVAVGVLVGALTIGSALPYLFRAVGAMSGADWRAIVASASLAAVVGGLVALAGVRDGPGRRPGAAVQRRDGGSCLRTRLGAPGEPRLPRAHVGALRDVDVGPAVHRRELRRRRAQGRRRWPASARSSWSPRAGLAASWPGSSPIGPAGRRSRWWRWPAAGRARWRSGSCSVPRRG